MSLQHQDPVKGPASQMPDPDRLILMTSAGGQAAVRKHGQGGHTLQHRAGAKDNSDNHNTLIYTVYTHIALSYICMPLQHPVTGPAAQVPKPDRLIP